MLRPLLPPQDVPAQAPARLRVVGGAEPGRELELAGRTVVVGSAEDCDWVLREPTVSPRHASLEPLGDALRVRDLGSEHGTWYLAARVTALEVPTGGMLELGAVRVLVLPGSLPQVSERTELGGLIGHSLRMRRLFRELEHIAPGEAPVLIQGETGTGKELVARALHALSPRAAGPLVGFHCGAVQPALAPSALFGQARGAFTDASRDVTGVFQRADGGVLLLDEVGHLPLELQPLLLRALESRTFTRVGERVPRRSDFRVIATTRLDLEAAVRSGAFRADLYHRLSALTLQVPPLRERLEDIPPLVRRFITRAAGRHVPVEPAVLAALYAHRWPGNVRELRNVVERVTTLGLEELPGAARSEPRAGFHQARERALQSFERAYLRTMLERHRGRAAAAREAGLARSYFYRLLEAHGLVGRGRAPRRLEDGEP
ncbi:MAG TPA: sigma 54-interacting transcriptional regulator [Myxococcus sp.]|nr:sigma 54-interacting transcriptional regulator [Myxococcus sp.]